MEYIADLFNDQKLFQRIGAWINKRSGNKLLIEFLFRASGAYLSLLRMRSLSAMCINQYLVHKHQLKILDEKIVFWSPTLIELLNQFSPYLSSLRIMQDLILPLYLKESGARISSPASLADAVDKLEKYRLDSSIKDLIKEYWKKVGKRVKQYRDIDQHYGNIVKHSFLSIMPIEKLVILLPDNPEDKKPKSFTYKKNIDALPFFESSFNAFF